MAKPIHWIKAARLRTLPLALSSIILGGFLSAEVNKFNLLVSVLAVLTTIFLQVLSNLANDFGDYKSGADNENRLGPKRGMQTGDISYRGMKNAIYFLTIISFISGSLLIYFGTLGMSTLNLLTFFALGIIAIAAAVNYTMGNNPYGYKGYGDLFVLIFFGFVGVIGTYYLNTHIVNFRLFWPGLSVGLLSMAMLNLNNMRDIQNDAQSGKNTLVVKMGYPKAKVYHILIVVVAFLSASYFTYLHFDSYFRFIFLTTLPLFLIDLVRIYRTSNCAKLDPFLKKQAINTLLFSLTFGLGLIL